MTALLVIATATAQPCLTRRRYGYDAHEFSRFRFYVREEYRSDMFARRDRDKIQPLEPLIEDLRSVASDPEATFFVVEQKGRETLTEALARGMTLPISRSRDEWIVVDGHRRPASTF